MKVSPSKPKGFVPTPITADTVDWMKLQDLVNISKCQDKIHHKVKSAEEKLKILQKEMTKSNYDKVSNTSTINWLQVGNVSSKKFY